MTNVHHIIVRAHESTRLAHDDHDRSRLTHATWRVFGARLLTYCLMDTHLHVLAEADHDAALAGARLTLGRYGQWFDARHRADHGVLVARVERVLPMPIGAELARGIHYLHQNPKKARLVDDEAEWPWSGARSFGGLSKAPFANVARAVELCGGDLWRLRPRWRSDLADMEPSIVPMDGVEVVLAASAQTFGVLPVHVAAKHLFAHVVAARTTFVHLGRLEGLKDAQLAPAIGRKRRRVSQLAGSPIDEQAVVIARTLMREPRLRRWLPSGLPVLGIPASQ
jgi:hypothetical protein